MAYGLTWDRFGLLMGIGLLVSAAIWFVTQRLKRRIKSERAAYHFANLFPTFLGLLLGLAFFPLALHITSVTPVIDYSWEYVAAALVAGFVGGEGASTSFEVVKFLREFLPELIRNRTGSNNTFPN